MVENEHYTPLVDVEGWLSACVVRDDEGIYLSVLRSSELSIDGPTYQPVRDMLARGRWDLTRFDRYPDEDTVGGVLEELHYQQVGLN